MKIKVNLEASQTSNIWKFDLEELGYSEEEWRELKIDEKLKAVTDWVNDLPEQPYWVLDNFTEIN